MAGRPPKASIDYAGWAVDIFDNEPKIDKLMDAQGCVGFTVYFFLCQKAYGSNGYFYPWCYDDAATTARKIGGGAGAKSVEETVRYCLQIGLFDKGLFEGWNILTSRGIQKRYAQVALTRTNKSVISEYWLLTEEESAGLITMPLNSISHPDNSIMRPDNSIINPQSKVKERKGKESRKDTGASAPRKQNKFIPPTLEKIQEYCRARKNNIDPQRFFDYFSESGWIDSKGNPVKNWKQKIITWEGNQSGANRGGPQSPTAAFGASSRVQPRYGHVAGTPPPRNVPRDE